MSDAVQNEQTKLPATGLNNLAFVIGVASALSLSLGTVVFTLIWLCSGTGLHWIARGVLRSLRP